MNDYSNVDNITALAMHMDKNLMFIGDSVGTIRRLSLPNGGQQQIVSPKSILRGRQEEKGYNISRINQLSIDWLNNHIYIASDSKISRCDFTGEYFEDLIIGFDESPSRAGLEGPLNIQVDPVNGYLLWSLRGEQKGGIYRVDLSSFTGSQKGSQHLLKGSDSKDAIHYQTVPLLIRGTDISAFTMDYLDHKIFFPRTKTTSGPKASSSISIVSVTDGKHPEEEVRSDKNIQTSMFASFKDIVYLNQHFYWTDGLRFFKEESRSGMFYHQEYSIPSGSASDSGIIVSVVLLDQQLQPIPIPKTPVTGLTAAFTDTSATVSWKKPMIIPEQGQGSWQGWLYELAIRNSSSLNDTLQDELMDTKSKIKFLTPETEYVIKVRAYSKTGKGPWSKSFVGKTLVAPKVFRHEVPKTPDLTFNSDRNLISWTKSEPYRTEIVFYELVVRDSENDRDSWQPAYNGTRNFWGVDQLPEGRNYFVKVRARSVYGDSEWSSENGKAFYYAPVTSPISFDTPSDKKSIEFWVGMILAAIFVVAILLVFYFIGSGELVLSLFPVVCCFCNRISLDKKRVFYSCFFLSAYFATVFNLNQ